MAKTLSEQLLALLDADGQAKVKAAMAANPTLIAQESILPSPTLIAQENILHFIAQENILKVCQFPR